VTMRRPWRLSGFLLAGLALVALSPAAAYAHEFPGAGDFYGGMLHAITSLDMLLAMVALGLLAGQQGREAALGALGVFPLALLLGATVGGLGTGPGDVTFPLVIAMVAIGLDTVAWRFVPGVAVAGLLLVAWLIGFVRWLSAPWTRMAVRVGGSWIAATGMMVLALKP
jgi:urease accessory protein